MPRWRIARILHNRRIDGALVEIFRSRPAQSDLQFRLVDNNRHLVRNNFFASAARHRFAAECACVSGLHAHSHFLCLSLRQITHINGHRISSILSRQTLRQLLLDAHISLRSRADVADFIFNSHRLADVGLLGRFLSDFQNRIDHRRAAAQRWRVSHDHRAVNIAGLGGRAADADHLRLFWRQIAKLKRVNIAIDFPLRLGADDIEIGRQFFPHHNARQRRVGQIRHLDLIFIRLAEPHLRRRHPLHQHRAGRSIPGGIRQHDAAGIGRSFVGISHRLNSITRIGIVAALGRAFRPFVATARCNAGDKQKNGE